MVNGTELYLLYTCCCTKWHINHPLPSPSLHYLVTSALQTKLCCSWVQPSYLAHFWFSIQIILYLQNYLYCKIKRGLKCHRDWSVKGKKQDLVVSPLWFGKGWAPTVCRCPGQLQGGVMAQWCMKGEKCWWKPRAEMTLLGKTLLGLLY